MTIWKFSLGISDESSVRMPGGARLLSVGEQDGGLVLWALVDEYAPLTWRAFRVAGTGNPLDDDVVRDSFIGTVQMPNGLVWHVFEVFA